MPRTAVGRFDEAGEIRNFVQAQCVSVGLVPFCKNDFFR